MDCFGVPQKTTSLLFYFVIYWFTMSNQDEPVDVQKQEDTKRKTTMKSDEDTSEDYGIGDAS
jgi:hypothetical protein